MGSNRDTRRSPTVPIQIANAGIEWVAEAEPRATQKTSKSTKRAEREEENKSDRAFLERIFGADRSCCIEKFSSSWHFTPSAHARAVKIVTAHAAVTPFLQGRWGILGADQVYTRPSASSFVLTVRVHLFNYTSNRMLDIRVDNDQVVSLDERGVHEYPESPHEMACAIELARLHPDLRDEVRNLVGHAILRVPSGFRDPSPPRRCMWVMFTECDDPTRQLPTRYTALVDLGSMEVIACGATPCDHVVAVIRDETRS
jgi:hypothetical protein